MLLQTTLRYSYIYDMTFIT